MLFIVAGRLRIVNFAASGREVAYAMIEAGSHVGELAALDGEPRSASVEALDDCLIAGAAERPVPRAAAAHGQLAVALLKNLARIIRRTDERIAELSVLGPCSASTASCCAWPRPSRRVAAIAPLPTQESLAALSAPPVRRWPERWASSPRPASPAGRAAS